MEESGVYEVCIIERPTADAIKTGAVAKVILPPTAVIANGRSAALLMASKLIKADYEPQRIHTMVRRFRGDTA